jgi:hypothetical protein
MYSIPNYISKNMHMARYIYPYIYTMTTLACLTMQQWFIYTHVYLNKCIFYLYLYLCRILFKKSLRYNIYVLLRLCYLIYVLASIGRCDTLIFFLNYEIELTIAYWAIQNMLLACHFFSLWLLLPLPTFILLNYVHLNKFPSLTCQWLHSH